jgi:hypothetical protein
LNDRPNDSLRTHLRQYLAARHVLFLDLKPGCWARNKAIGGRVSGQLHAHIDAAVGRILVSAPSYARGWESTAMQFQFTKAGKPRLGIW